MDQRLEQILIEKYPDLCQEAHLTIRQSPMAWGFEVGDGWYNLLDELLEKLSKYDGVVLSQVKEKFGILTVYVRSSIEETRDLINEYEIRSTTICETCGKPGKRRGKGWIYTACDKCSETYERRKQEQSKEMNQVEK